MVFLERLPEPITANFLPWFVDLLVESSRRLNFDILAPFLLRFADSNMVSTRRLAFDFLGASFDFLEVPLLPFLLEEADGDVIILEGLAFLVLIGVSSEGVGEGFLVGFAGSKVDDDGVVDTWAVVVVVGGMKAEFVEGIKLARSR